MLTKAQEIEIDAIWQLAVGVCLDELCEREFISRERFDAVVVPALVKKDQAIEFMCAENARLKLVDESNETAHAYVQQLERQVSDLTAQLAAMTQERDDYYVRKQEVRIELEKYTGPLIGDCHSLDYIVREHMNVLILKLAASQARVKELENRNG